MGIVEEPHAFLYYQSKYQTREPLILFGGCIFENADDTTGDLIRDLKKLLKSLLDSIEQAYLIRFDLREKIRGISGELTVELTNLRQHMQDRAQDYHSHFGKNRYLRLQMMTQLYQRGQANAIWMTSGRFPPFQMFFLHWLEEVFNEFFLVDLINAIVLNVISKLGSSPKAHALLSKMAAEISIYIRNELMPYTI
ncbi:MAG: hypothetical protein ACFFE8_13410 [Candidatus Heimdallarchaeota archaeon]